MRDAILSAKLQLYRRQQAIYIGALTVFTLIIYGGTLRLPFMADDFFQLPFAANHTLAEIWRSADGLYYFRPIAFTLWRWSYQLFQAHNPFALHLLNLGLHIGNGLLVGWLAGRLFNTTPSPDWPRRYVAATLYIIYPFSYETVPWVAAVMHLQVTFCALVAVMAYLKANEQGAGRRLLWVALSLIMTVLGPYAHENGILIAPLVIAAAFLTTRRWLTQWRSLLLSFGWFGPTALWWLHWRGVSAVEGAGNLAIQSLDGMRRNVAYAVQAIAYPFTWLTNWLFEQTGVDEFTLTFFIGGLIVAGLLIGQLRTGRLRDLLYSWAWIVLAILPALLFLEFPYFASAPRVFTLSSVGIAWLWAEAIVRLWRSQRWQPIYRMAAAGVAACILFASFTFINQQLPTYTLGGGLIDEVVRATEISNRQNQRAVFVNLPIWLAPPQSSYALGEEGAMLMPAVEELETLVSVHTGQSAQIGTFRWAEVRRPIDLYGGMLGEPPEWQQLLQTASRYYLVDYREDAITTQFVGAAPVDVSAKGPIAQLGDILFLHDAIVVQTGAHLSIELVWSLNTLPTDDLTLFVHVLNANGELVGQADGYALGGVLPFHFWQTNMGVQDYRAIESAPDAVTVAVGVYSRNSGERLNVTLLQSADWGVADGAIRLPVR